MSSLAARTPLISLDSLSARLKFVLAVFFFRSSLDLCYIYYIHPAFESHFLTPMRLEFDLLRYLLSYSIVVLLAMFLPLRNDNLSGVFFAIAMIFLIVPMTVMYGFDSSLPGDAILAGVVAVVAAFSAVAIRIVRVRIPLAKAGQGIATFLALGFVAYFLAWSFVSGAAANINFDFTQIYEYREIAGGLLDVGVFSYLNVWAQKVFNPLLLALGLYRRNRLLVLFALAMQIYFFGVTQHRAHLFVPVLIVMVYWLYLSRISISRLYLIAGTGLLVFLGLTLVANLDAAAAIVLRRAFFVPASVTFDWVAFFLERPKVYFADNLLAAISDSVYSGRTLPFFLGDYMAPGRQLAFNNGIVGAGFAQAGLTGVALYAFLLGLVVKFVNALIRQGLPVFIAAAILIAPLRTAWADSDLFTALLSHGIAMSVIVLWLLGRLQPAARRS